MPNLATKRGTPAYTAGKFSNALTAGAVLNADVDALFVGASGGAYPDATYEAWFKTTSTTVVNRLVVGRSGWYFWGLNNGVAVVSITGNGVNTLTGITGATGLNDNAWHHGALVISGQTPRFYVDGILVWTGATAVTISATATDTYNIGGQLTSTTNDFASGQIDEARVSKVARYSSAFTPSASEFTVDSDTVALYHLSDASDAVLADSTPPTPPTAATATGGVAKIAITSSGATDATGVARTRLYSGATLLGSVTGTSGDVTPVAAGTYSTLTVAAVDPAGNESTKFATTPASVTVVSSVIGNITPDDANIVYSPYNWDVTSTRALSVNSGAYFRCEIVGSPTAITLNFDVSTLAGTFPLIAYRVDQGPWTSVTVDATVALTMPSNSWAKHHVEVVYRATTGLYRKWIDPQSCLKFTGITTSPNTATTASTMKRGLRGIVFGDSITEGINTIGSGSGLNPHDSMQGFAYRLGVEVGCELGVVGFASQGISVTGNGAVPIFGSTYNKVADGINRDFATSPPDFIAIVHGQNDSTTNTQTAYLAVVNALLAATPATTKILLVRPFTGLQATNIQAVVTSAASTRVSYVDTTGWWSTTEAADSVHPYGFAHTTQLAPRLAAAIRTQLRRGGGYINASGVAKPVSGIRA